MVNVGIIGVTGYVGMEIVRLLHSHPEVNISVIVNQSFTGMKMSDVYPHLKNVFEMECRSLDIEGVMDKADIFVFALPDTASQQIIPAFIEKNRRVIDHSGSFRYRDVKVYEEWYKVKHAAPDYVNMAVYGLPEIYRDKIRTAGLVANPGCYPTCSILGLAPLLAHKLVDTRSIIINAVSGVSGAGRKTDLMYQFSERTESFCAYGVASHRHTSEIEQELSLLAGEKIRVSFTPHLAPMKRGMLCTIYADLAEERNTAELIDIYKEYYRDEFFVRVLDEGKVPETKHTAGSNFIDIGIVVDKRLNRVIVLSALDNLGKGAAGQAVQVLNLMCGFPENTGLKSPGLYL